MTEASESTFPAPIDAAQVSWHVGGVASRARPEPDRARRPDRRAGTQGDGTAGGSGHPRWRRAQPRRSDGGGLAGCGRRRQRADPGCRQAAQGARRHGARAGPCAGDREEGLSVDGAGAVGWRVDGSNVKVGAIACARAVTVWPGTGPASSVKLVACRRLRRGRHRRHRRRRGVLARSGTRCDAGRRGFGHCSADGRGTLLRRDRSGSEAGSDGAGDQRRPDDGPVESLGPPRHRRQPRCGGPVARPSRRVMC